jgi:ABC-type Zn uptake system ZnuABC Zn-binding protein ZnuA
MTKKDFYKKNLNNYKKKYKLLDKKYEQKFNKFGETKKDS